MIGSDPSREMRERIWLALVVLAAVYGSGTVGLWLLGRTQLGPRAWSLAECAYFTVITVTTVGFAELPHLAQVRGGHLLTVAVLITGLGVSLYFMSALTTFFIEGQFGRVRKRRKMTKAIGKLNDHIVVCGAGTTGIHIVEELLATRRPLVVIDNSPAQLERIQELSSALVPTVLGDATEDATLRTAGIERASGVVAALTNDRDNLFVVVSARQLNPKLRIIAKGVEMRSADKLRLAGADRVVNPAFIGGVRMVSELIRPQVVEFLDLMLRDKDKNLRIEEVSLAAGSSLVGLELGKAQIRRQSNVLVIAVREPGEAGRAGRYVYNPGPDTLLRAGMSLIVLGEVDSVAKLRGTVDQTVEIGASGRDQP